MTELEIIKRELKCIKEMLSMSKKVLTKEEAAIFTNLSERTIYKKTSLGEIPHYKQAGKLFFNRLELEDWLLSNRGFSKEDISRAAATYNMNASFNR